MVTFFRPSKIYTYQWLAHHDSADRNLARQRFRVSCTQQFRPQFEFNHNHLVAGLDQLADAPIVGSLSRPRLSHQDLTGELHPRNAAFQLPVGDCPCWFHQLAIVSGPNSCSIF